MSRKLSFSKISTIYKDNKYRRFFLQDNYKIEISALDEQFSVKFDVNRNHTSGLEVRKMANRPSRNVDELIDQLRDIKDGITANIADWTVADETDVQTVHDDLDSKNCLLYTSPSPRDRS